MKVKVREEYDSRAVPFDECTLTEAEGFIKLMEYWGGVTIAGENRTSLSGQIVYEHGECFFEVVVHEEEE